MQSPTGLPSACSCHLLQRWERDISFWLPKPHPRLLPLYKEAEANLFPNTAAQLISLLRSLCSLPCPSTSSPHCWCLITSTETCFPCSPHKRWLSVSFNGPWVPGPGGRGHNYSCSPSLSYTLLFPLCLQISLLCQSSRLPTPPCPRLLQLSAKLILTPPNGKLYSWLTAPPFPLLSSPVNRMDTVQTASQPIMSLVSSFRDPSSAIPQWPKFTGNSLTLSTEIVPEPKL